MKGLLFPRRPISVILMELLRKRVQERKLVEQENILSWLFSYQSVTHYMECGHKSGTQMGQTEENWATSRDAVFQQRRQDNNRKENYTFQIRAASISCCQLLCNSAAALAKNVNEVAVHRRRGVVDVNGKPISSDRGWVRKLMLMTRWHASSEIAMGDWKFPNIRLLCRCSSR